MSVKIFLIGYTSIESEEDVQATESPDTTHITIVIATPIPAGVVEMVTPGDNTRDIPVRVGIELSRLHQRTGGMPAAHIKTTNSTFIESFSLQQNDKTGQGRRNFGFPVR